MNFDQFLSTISDRALSVLDGSISYSDYRSIDLSVANPILRNIDITQAAICASYINNFLEEQQGKVAYGGYLEERNLYGGSTNFIGSEQRNIHLGLDLWAPVGTEVRAVLDGRVHSFQNNTTMGDYGPTIILNHQFGAKSFYTLYVHLSLESLTGIHVGKIIKQGELIGSFGHPEINVGYAPHLHFQIIKDLEGHIGDYPGVCSSDKLVFYKENCPDPNLLLKLP